MSFRETIDFRRDQIWSYNAFGDYTPFFTRDFLALALPCSFTGCSSLLRATACNASHVLAIVLASVCLSVCPIKKVQARITKSSPCVTASTLVYRHKILCAWMRGFPSNGGVKVGYTLECAYFTAIGSYSV